MKNIIPFKDGDRFFLIRQDKCQAVMKDLPPDGHNFMIPFPSLLTLMIKLHVIHNDK